ncbi:large ribosomal subunit protein mL54-like [Clavelina lepadiformis]|uniref:large ribosomal subunit protein mL54-like n=1 Tax=Clavelina lepadiformis TaxID=159417 RepID=UPI00404298BA
MFCRNLVLQNLAKDRFGSVEFSTFGRLFAKPKVAGGGGGKSAFKAKVTVEEPEPVRDTKVLVTRCCGLNKYKDGEDPVLKPDSEYPEWLWSLHIGENRPYYEYDPNTKKYWFELRRHKIMQRNRARKGVRFYEPPKQYELEFVSRLPLKKAGEGTS